MQFRDQVLRCAATGKEFVWTVAEQRERARNGLPLDPPLYCPEVRAADSRLGESYDKPKVAAEPVDGMWSDQNQGYSEQVGLDKGTTVAARARVDSPAASRPQARERQRSGSSDGVRGKPRGFKGGRSRGPAPQTELRVRHTGTVKWFDEDRGYGFVADDDGGELFLHASCLLVEDSGGLREGTPIEYEVERTDRGPQAVDVVLLA